LGKERWGFVYTYKISKKIAVVKIYLSTNQEPRVEFLQCFYFRGKHEAFDRRSSQSLGEEKGNQLRSGIHENPG
jgi:hypothetical protein